MSLSLLFIVWIFLPLYLNCLSASENLYNRPPEVSHFLPPEVHLCFQMTKHTTIYIKQTLPKAQRARGLSSGYHSKFIKSHQKFSNKSCSFISFLISSKQQLQNLIQTSAFRLNLNLKILTEPSFFKWNTCISQLV